MTPSEHQPPLAVAMSLASECRSIEAAALVARLSDLCQASRWKYKRSDARRAQFNSAVAATVADILNGAKGERGAYHRATPSRWDGGPLPVAFRAFNDITLALEKLDFVTREIGGSKWRKDVRPGRNGSEATIFLATQRLIELARETGIALDDLPRHFIERADPLPIRLKDRRKSRGEVASEHVLDKDCPQVQSAADPVRRINAFLRGFDYAPGISTDLFRQFDEVDDPNFAWDRGGRLYGRGSRHFHRLRSDERSQIRINGEPVCELDLRASQLTIAHGILGHHLDVSQDPYTVPPFARSVVKAWVTITLGKGTEKHRHWPGDVESEYGALPPIEVVNRGLVARFPIFDGWSKAIKDRDRTRAISTHELTFLESEAIILTVVELMSQHSTPALPVFDALVVPVSARQLCVETLSAQFKAVCGISPFLKG